MPKRGQQQNAGHDTDGYIIGRTNIGPILKMKIDDVEFP